MSDNASLLSFPCTFPIKAMGPADEEFALRVRDVVSRYASTTQAPAIRSRASRNGTYQSITILIEAENQSQLDAIYRELSVLPGMLMVL